MLRHTLPLEDDTGNSSIVEQVRGERFGCTSNRGFKVQYTVLGQQPEPCQSWEWQQITQ